MTDRRARSGDVPGDTVASQAMFDRFVYDVGKGWLDLIRASEAQARNGLHVTRVTMRGDLATGQGLLVVLLADGPDGPVVAFHNVDDPQTVWRGLANRMTNGSLKWREDEYAVGSRGQGEG